MTAERARLLRFQRLERRRSGPAMRPEAHQTGFVRVLEQPRSTVARVHVAGDGEQPRAQTGVGLQAWRMPDEPHPRLLDEVFGGIAPARQPQQEGEDPGAEGGVDVVDGIGVPGAQARHEGQFVISFHAGRTARADRA